MLDRTLKLPELLDKKSHFLFGPRGSGKTTLIKNQLSEHALRIDLLNSDYFLRLAARPSELEQIVRAKKEKIIIIDEVQKLPILLDEVHRLIEEYKIKFLLTGSSARKLKRGGANLLGGRAWTVNLFPLTSNEIIGNELKDFDLNHYLQYGGLPSIYFSDYPQDELQAYMQNYLVEEISAEGVVRDLPLFSRFLQKAAISNASILNFTEIASDLGVSPSTIREYYRILEDTLLGFMVTPYRKSTTRKEVATSKFYLFDVGVSRHLRSIQNSELDNQNTGNLFEHFIAQELRAYLGYNKKNLQLQFWRTHDQQEVDFIISNYLALEVKLTKSANARMAKGLKSFISEYSFKHNILVSQDPIERLEQGVNYMYYKNFLKRLWVGEFFK